MGTIIKLIELRYRPADAPGQWTPLPPVPPGSATVNVPLEPGRAYVIQARSVAACGAVSQWVEVNHTPANPAKAPKPPTNPAADGMADGVHVSWTIGDKRANIVTEINWAYDVNNAPDETWFALPEASGASTIHRVTDGVERWYRVRHVDYLGNVSAWTTPVKAKPKTVADGADVTERKAIPNGIAVGGTLWAEIFINTSSADGSTNPGEITYADGAPYTDPESVKFQHPNGNVYIVGRFRTDTSTHLEGPEADYGWVAFVGAEPTRFSLSADFVLVKKIDDRWYYDNNTSWVPFDTHEDDCIIAAVEHDAGDPVGISRIRRFAKRYDSYADGTAVDNLRPNEKGADTTGNHNSKGNDAHAYSGWVFPADLRATYGKGVFSETIDAPTAIGLDASVGTGTVAIGIGGFSYPPGVTLTFQSDAGATWVRAETSENVWGGWHKQFNRGDGNRPQWDGDVDGIPTPIYDGRVGLGLNSDGTFPSGKNKLDWLLDTVTYRKTGAGYVDASGRVNGIYDSSAAIKYDGPTAGDGIRRARAGLTADGYIPSGRNKLAWLTDRTMDLIADAPTAGRYASRYNQDDQLTIRDWGWNGHKLTVGGSGQQLGSTNNSPPLMGWNRTNALLTANVLNPGTGYAWVDAHTRYAAFGSTAFPFGQIGGLGYGITIDCWMEAPGYNLGNYVMSTDGYGAIKGPNRAYIGRIVTKNSDGSGGSNPGDWDSCLPATELPALAVGDMRPCLDDQGRFLGPRPLQIDRGVKLAECVLLITEDGYGLPMSRATPNLCADGEQRYASNMIGHATAVDIDRQHRWRRIVRVQPLGVMPVRHRSFGGVSFSAPGWDLRGWRWWWWRLTSRPWRRSRRYEIYSHNMKA